MSAVSKLKGDTFEFYGGKAVLKLRMYGDKPSFKRVGSETTILSVTAVTGKLDKARALLPWACGLVGAHMRAVVEAAKTQLSKEELLMAITEAVSAPDRAKMAGATAGDLIHDYAHDFAELKLAKKKDTPSLDHIDEKDETHQKALNGINAFLDWYGGNKVKFLNMEKLVYYNSFYAGDTDEAGMWEYYGFMDLEANVNGDHAITDYKSSKGIYNEQRYQVSALHKANGVDGSVGLIVNFNKETGDLITPLVLTKEDLERDFVAFRGLHMLATRERELEKAYKSGNGK